MRLAAQAKSGYYPASPAAIKMLAKHLRLPPPPEDGSRWRATDISMLDPCAGEGTAIACLAASLGLSEPQVYAVELNAARADRCRAALPHGGKVIGPCSFFGTEISVQSFSLIYLNPPFDYAEGGLLREEEAFLGRAFSLLAPLGVMVLVAPYAQVVGRYSMINMLDSMFDHIEVYRFPEGVDESGVVIRPYNEVVVIGLKRKARLDSYAVEAHGELNQRGFRSASGMKMSITRLPSLGDHQPESWRWSAGGPWRHGSELHPVGQRQEIDAWMLPYSWPPRKFTKAEMTEWELEQAVRSSPLWSIVRDPGTAKAPRPPLSLGKGHTSLSIVSGTLDGLVPSDPPHVARGYSIKVEYENKAQGKSEVNTETGAVTETKVMSEKPVSIVRCVEMDGSGKAKIYEFRSDSNEAIDDTDSDDWEDD